MSGGLQLAHSKEFFELMKNIAEARSKQEEDAVVADEVSLLKQKLQDPKIPPKKMKEYLIRAVYCELLGHDASFAYFEALKLCSAPTLAEKRVGYLTVGLCLHPEHELMLLLINTMLRDLSSTNYLDIAAALGAISRLSSKDTAPALLPPVLPLLHHREALVRKKAVVALAVLHALDPSHGEQVENALKTALTDKDPSVMAGALCLLEELVRIAPVRYRFMVQSLVSILKQIVDHRLPRDYDYHRIPAPWLQMHLVKLLGILGADDAATSAEMYDVLSETIRRADIGITIGHAVIFETVRTVTMIHPKSEILSQCASVVARWLSSSSNNLKYTGITALTHIVRVHPNAATEHQMSIIDCLEDRDETLQRKTIELLVRITNPSNVTIIAEKLQRFLDRAVDPYMRSDLVSKLCTLAEQFAPSPAWFVDTMNKALLSGGSLVPQKFVHSLSRTIAEGCEDSEEGDELRRYAFSSYLEILDPDDDAVLPDSILRIGAWVLGEYMFLLPGEQSRTVQCLSHLLQRPVENLETRSWAVSALMKVAAQFSLDDASMQLVSRCSSSRATTTRQRALEFMAIKNRRQILQVCLPADGACEDVSVDESLGFLDGFVQKQLRDGAKPYRSFSERAATRQLSLSPEDDSKSSQLRFQAYAAPQSRHRNVQLPPNVPETGPRDAPSAPGGVDASQAVVDTHGPSSPAVVASLQPVMGLKVEGVKKRWTVDGFDDEEEEESGSREASSRKNVTSPPSVSAQQGAAKAPIPVSSAAPGSIHVPSPDDIPHQAMPLSSIISQEEKKSASVAPKPVQTEKERLAASLFGGGVPASSSAGGGSFRSRKTAQPAAAAPPSSVPADGASRAASKPQQASVGSEYASQNNADLLDMGGPSAAAAPPTRAPGRAATGGVPDLDSLLDFGRSPAGSAAVPSTSSPKPGLEVQRVPAAQHVDLDELLGGSSPLPAAGPHSMPLSSPSAFGFDLAAGPSSRAEPASPALPEDLMLVAAPGFHTGISLQHQAAGHLVMRLLLCNDGVGQLSNVTLELQALAGVKLSLGTEDPARIRVVGSRLVAAALPGGTTTVALATMVCNSISVVGSRLVGRVSYVDPVRGGVNLPISFEFPSLAFALPGSSITTTALFGKTWPAIGNERKHSAAVTFKNNTVDKVRDTLEGASANFRIVDVINSELIGSLTVRENGQDVVVLGHFKASPSSVFITLRSASADCADVALRSLVSILSA